MIEIFLLIELACVQWSLKVPAAYVYQSITFVTNVFIDRQLFFHFLLRVSRCVLIITSSSFHQTQHIYWLLFGSMEETCRKYLYLLFGTKFMTFLEVFLFIIHNKHTMLSCPCSQKFNSFIMLDTSLRQTSFATL